MTATRIARNGSLYTHEGKINILNAKFREDFSPIEKDCNCYIKIFSKAYLTSFFMVKEMLASTLASIHNLFFMNKICKDIHKTILEDKFEEFKGVY